MGQLFKKITASIAATFCILSLGCAAGKTSSITAADSTPSTTPNISQILPQTIPVGAPSQTIRVLGTNFADQAVILWNGNALSTSRIDASTLAGVVDSSVLASPATIQLQVKNTTDGRQSAAVPLTVASAVANTTPTLTVTSSSMAAGTTGVAYAQSLQASGGTPSYGWAVTSGTLPNGLTLDPSTGILAGTPSLAGTFNFTVGIADSGSPVQTATASTSVTIAPTPLAITSATLASSTINVTYFQTFQASGGTPGYIWSLIAGGLPAGLTLNANGSITGTPTVAGTFNLTASVSDSGSPAQTRTVATSIVIAATQLSITSSSLSGATNGIAYSQSLQAAGGTPSYSWSVTAGALPAGLTLSASGLVSGIPTSAGTFNFTASVTDSGSPVQTQTVAPSIAVLPAQLTITTTSLASTISGASYSQTLQVAGGTPSYTWALTSGSLPTGFTLAANGTISGTPTVAGTFTFTVTVTDSASQSKSFTTSIAVSPSSVLTILSSALPNGTNGTAYTQSLSAAGGTPSYTWSVTAGSLPSGLTLSAGGAVSGTPTSNGTFSFTVTVADSSIPSQTKSTDTTIVIAPPTLTISSSSLAAGTSGVAYSQSLGATGGTPGFTWTITSGSLPAGLTFSAAGTVSGTPTVSGTFPITATVTDNGSPAQTKSVNASVTIAPTTLTITSSTLAGGTKDTTYSQSVGASGGTTGYTWSVTTGSLPAGLTLSTSGTISGTPTTSGTSNFTITVTDSGSPAQIKSTSTSIVVAPVTLAIASPTLTAGTTGTAYSQSLSATGGTTGYTWSVTAGSLPAGLTLSTSGAISGTPTTSGTSNFTITVTDSGTPAQTKSTSTSIVIASATLTITSSSMAAAAKSTAYSQSLTATGGTPSYTWTVTTGSLPAGLTLSAAGIISGTPTIAGTSSFTLTVTDAASPVQTKTLSTSIVVAPTALTITSFPPASGTNGTAYSQSLTASGGTPGYTWSITAGALPAGLTLTAAGVFTGTPTASGVFTFTATVTDNGSPVQTKSTSLSVAVTASALSISSSALTSGTAGTAYSQSLSATGGTPTYSWSVTSGSLPAGLSLSSAGVVSGTPTASGTFNVAVTVTDAGSPAQTKSATTSIVIAAGPLSITASTFVSGTNGIAFAQSLAANGGTPGYTWSITSGSLPAGLTLAATTGVISGSPTLVGTATFTVTVTDNGSPAQTKSSISTIIILAALPTGPGTTWYIRPDGGTRYSAAATTGQCDGKADAPYGGVGTNQHCAFSDFRNLWDDQTYGGFANWAIAGGDTVIVRGGPWRVGFNQGSNPNDVFCVGGNGPFSCGNPIIPAGTASQHTRILGENYAACGATNKTQVFGGYGVTVALNLNGAQYTDIQCLDITRHSQCVVHGSPAYPSYCSSSFPLDDYDSTGITTDVNTHDLFLTDLWIHGHPDRGIKGPIGGVVTATRVVISTNGMAGWDFDDGRGTALQNGVWNFNYSTIEWSGCNQEYPFVHAIPVVSCYGQSSGGYGDGVGTPMGTGLDVHIDHSLFRYNTQDGLDIGHVDTGVFVLSITNSQFYGNSGGQYKWGANFSTAIITNNLSVANCFRLSKPMTGVIATYNTHLGDFCRAQDNISFNFRQGQSAFIANNTFVTYAPTSFDIACWDTSCSTSTLTFQNNLVLGYDNPATYNQGGQSGGPGGFYYQNPIGKIIRNNNMYYGMRNQPCPTGFNAEFCANPLFVNQPVWVDETSLDNFNFNLTPGSPAHGIGMVLPSITLDYNGVLRPNPPTVGALE